MNPYVYLMYLCFLDNGSDINIYFKKWMNTSGSYAYSELKMRIRGFAIRMEYKARCDFIYEAQKEWAEVNMETFVKFLDGYRYINENS